MFGKNIELDNYGKKQKKFNVIICFRSISVEKKTIFISEIEIEILCNLEKKMNVLFLKMQEGRKNGITGNGKLSSLKNSCVIFSCVLHNHILHQENILSRKKNFIFLCHANLSFSANNFTQIY